ncbi:MAG: hypothetical protein ACK5F7_01390, partial [Planctomycetaceae bacterium]
MPPTNAPSLPQSLKLASPWQSSHFESAGRAVAGGTLFSGRCSSAQEEIPLELYWLTALGSTSVKPQSIDR